MQNLFGQISQHLCRNSNDSEYIYHLTDPQQAFSEAFRIIRPGGRYAFSQWVSPQDSELFSMVFSAVMRHADMSKVPPAPDAFAYSDPDLCRESLAAAGFTDIEIINVPGYYHASAADFWPKFLQFSVRTPIIIDCQTGAVARAIEADVERAINSLAVDGEVTIAMPSFVVVGIRPEEVSGN